MSEKKSGYLEAARTQRVNHPLSVFAILRLHRDFQNRVADIQIHVCPVVMNDHDVRAFGGDDAAGEQKRARLVRHPRDVCLSHGCFLYSGMEKAHLQQQVSSMTSG